jgi:hypothetical protein
LKTRLRDESKWGRLLIMMNISYRF